MTCYLLTWNPEKWPENKYEEYVEEAQKGEELRWSCGVTKKKIVPGDSFYLLRQGKGRKGIVGAGAIVRAPYSALHYHKEKAKLGGEANYVDVKFDHIVSSQQFPIIDRDELVALDPSSIVWNTQASGREIPAELAHDLDHLWRDRIGTAPFTYPEEVGPEALTEGTKKQITVNAYERNPEARRRCIEKHGLQCAVCNFHFELFYGLIGKGYIHVHHLRPISSIGSEYEVDPENDLRPVCPNCHAMLHRGEELLSIEELRAKVKAYGALLD